MTTYVLVGFVLALGIGFAMGWLAGSLHARRLEEERRAADARRIGELEGALKRQEEAIQQVAAQLHDQFSATSRTALQQSREDFLALAKETLKILLEQAKGDVYQTTSSLQQLVAPLQQALTQYQQSIQEFAEKVKQDYGALSSASQDLKTHLAELQVSTQQLKLALSGDIRSRGNWGQLQLERVAELAGLKKGIDYDLQVTAEDGRPDMVVYLPGNRCITVDAKAPAIDLPEDGDTRQFKAIAEKFGASLKNRVKELSSREYWKKVDNSLDLVVLFLGAEGPFALAVELNRDIIEDALNHNVLIATPSTLYAIFRAVAATWKSHRAAEGVKRIIDAGSELYSRLATFAEHFKELGKHLRKTVESYNRAVGSYESRLLPGARKLYELVPGDSSQSPDNLEAPPVDERVRSTEVTLEPSILPEEATTESGSP